MGNCQCTSRSSAIPDAGVFQYDKDAKKIVYVGEDAINQDDHLTPSRTHSTDSSSSGIATIHQRQSQDSLDKNISNVRSLLGEIAEYLDEDESTVAGGESVATYNSATPMLKPYVVSDHSRQAVSPYEEDDASLQTQKKISEAMIRSEEQKMINDAKTNISTNLLSNQALPKPTFNKEEEGWSAFDDGPTNVASSYPNEDFDDEMTNASSLKGIRHVLSEDTECSEESDDKDNKHVLEALKEHPSGDEEYSEAEKSAQEESIDPSYDTSSSFGDFIQAPALVKKSDHMYLEEVKEEPELLKEEHIVKEKPELLIVESDTGNMNEIEMEQECDAQSTVSENTENKNMEKNSPIKKDLIIQLPEESELQASNNFVSPLAHNDITMVSLDNAPSRYDQTSDDKNNYVNLDGTGSERETDPLDDSDAQDDIHPFIVNFEDDVSSVEDALIQDIKESIERENDNDVIVKDDRVMDKDNVVCDLITEISSNSEKVHHESEDELVTKKPFKTSCGDKSLNTFERDERYMGTNGNSCVTERSIETMSVQKSTKTDNHDGKPERFSYNELDTQSNFKTSSSQIYIASIEDDVMRKAVENKEKLVNIVNESQRTAGSPSDVITNADNEKMLNVVDETLHQVGINSIYTATSDDVAYMLDEQQLHLDMTGSGESQRSYESKSESLKSIEGQLHLEMTGSAESQRSYESKSKSLKSIERQLQHLEEAFQSTAPSSDVKPHNESSGSTMKRLKVRRQPEGDYYRSPSLSKLTPPRAQSNSRGSTTPLRYGYQNSSYRADDASVGSSSSRISSVSSSRLRSPTPTKASLLRLAKNSPYLNTDEVLSVYSGVKSANSVKSVNSAKSSVTGMSITPKSIPWDEMQSRSVRKASPSASSINSIDWSDSEHIVEGVEAARRRVRAYKEKQDSRGSGSVNTVLSEDDFIREGRIAAHHRIVAKKATEEKKCSNKWNPTMFVRKKGCIRCLALASKMERQKYLMEGRHARISMTCGGCDNENCNRSRQFMLEHPEVVNGDQEARLCRICYNALHR